MKSERERQIPCDITYTWNLKYDTNEHVNETNTDSQREQTCDWQGGGGLGEGRIGSLGLTDPSYYYLYVGQINNEVLLIAQRTVFHTLWETIMEKNMRKNIYMYKWITLMYSRN